MWNKLITDIHFVNMVSFIINFGVSRPHAFIAQTQALANPEHMSHFHF